jgi:sporulation protein YlmC with PRC-barrel domain
MEPGDRNRVSLHVLYRTTPRLRRSPFKRLTGATRFLEEDMLKMNLAAGLAAAALMTTAAVAQTSPAPAAGTSPTATQTQSSTMPGGSGQFMTQMSADLIRGSKLMGVDVYGSDNQKIGDVDEVLLDKQGNVKAVVVGIGGFLGIGQKDVAIPYDQVQWMSTDEARTASNTQSGTSTTGGVTTPATPSGTASTTSQPSTTGSTGAGTTASANDGTPARAMVKMSKADLQNAPEFRYSASTGAGAGGTNPPAGAARPGTAPQQ